MMAKIHINKSNPNFNGFECAYFLHETSSLLNDWGKSSNSVRMFYVIYYSTCSHLLWNLAFWVFFCHSRDDFIQFVFLLHRHTHLRRTNCCSSSFFWSRDTQFEYFVWMYFIFRTLLLNLTYFRCEWQGKCQCQWKRKRQ